MLIHRIFSARQGERRDATGRRSRSTRCFEFDQLEARTALSVGPQSAVVALDTPSADLLGTLAQLLEARAAEISAGIVDTGASPGPAASLSAFLDEIPHDSGLGPVLSELGADLEAALGPFPLAPDLLGGLESARREAAQVPLSLAPELPGGWGSARMEAALESTLAESFPQLMGSLKDAATTGPEVVLDVPEIVSIVKDYVESSIVKTYLEANNLDLEGTSPASTRGFDYNYFSTAAEPWSDGVTIGGPGPFAVSTASETLENPATGWAGVGWNYNVTAPEFGAASYQGPASSEDDAWASGGGPDEPARPPSIMAGEIPLDILLADPMSAAAGASSDLQQVAELIPLEDSSLALVATLWSVTSDSSTEALDGEALSGGWAEPFQAPTMLPAWAAYVMGSDEGFERSRDTCGRILVDEARNLELDGEMDTAGSRLGSRCPIIPTPEANRQADRATLTGAADPNRALASPSLRDGEPLAQLHPDDDSPHDADGWRPQAEWAAPLAWAASGFTLAAGWVWARRRFRRKLPSQANVRSTFRTRLMDGR
jgi:hypothetical protein